MKIKYNYRVTACYMIIFILSFYAGISSGNFKRIISLENKFRTYFYSSSVKSSKDYQTVIVAIDERSFQALKTETELSAYKNFSWPWPQALHAALLEKLLQNGAERIGFDLIFSESLEKTNLAEYSSPQKLISVKKRFDVPVVLASRDNEGNITMPPDAYRQNGFVTGLINIPETCPAGTFKYNFTQKNGDSLALAVARCRGGDMELIRRGWTPDTLKRPRLMAFGNSQGLNFPVISYTDALLDRVPRDVQMIWGKKTLNELLNGKAVLIGLTSHEECDMVSTPVGRMPGVEVHANALSMLYKKEAYAISETGKITNIAILIAALLTGLLIIASFSSFAVCVLAGLSLSAIYVYSAAFIFNEYSLLIPVTNILIAFLFFIIASKALASIVERKGKLFLNGAFGRYVSAEVSEMMLENPELVSLGGDRKEVTIFFADIADFTETAEKMKAEEVITLLSGYLHMMSNEIISRNGTLDKYLGDAVMAFWGAPVEITNHQEMACVTAIEAQKKLAEFNGSDIGFVKPELKCRIGINTGSAVVGNAGSEERFDYTAIGESVNIASRLEGLNKVYGTSIIISGSTLEKVGNSFETRLLDKISVTGRTDVTEIYELIGYKQLEESGFIKLNNEAMSAYFAKDWAKALELFEKKKNEHNDKHSQVFIERINKIMKDPGLMQKHDGVWTLHRK